MEGNKAAKPEFRILSIRNIGETDCSCLSKLLLYICEVTLYILLAHILNAPCDRLRLLLQHRTPLTRQPRSYFRILPGWKTAVHLSRLPPASNDSLLHPKEVA